jgi:hypothetical protein
MTSLILTSPATAIVPDPIVGDWNVTYGNPDVVAMTLSGGVYTETAVTPVQVVGSSCDLPVGTVIATFSSTGGDSYSGQHGLWFTSNCSFAEFTSFTGTLSSNGNTLTGVLGNGEGVTFTRTPPTTSVLIPSTGKTLSGSTTLDASALNATSVEFRLFGGIYGYNAPVICTATPTIYGWLCNWNTATVPNGTYLLASEAFNSAGTAFSSGVSVTVANPPTTSVVIPSNGATVSGTTTLDSSASNATSVEFWLLGGSYGFSGHLVGTATPTIYGWLDSWNTTTVPNGTYLLLSEAFGAGGSTFSGSAVSITVHN